MERKLKKLILGVAIAAIMSFSASALNSTCRPGNKATFETLAEAHASAASVVRTYEGNDTVDPATKQAKLFVGHPALDAYPKGTTFVYRSPNMYGGRAAARLNTNLIVYIEQHFADKDAAYAYLKSAGLIEIADKATGSIVLVTPIGKTFGAADIPSYYFLQTAMFSQKASGTRDDGTPVYYSDAEYFGGYGYIYFVGVDGGASFFNNSIATTFDFVSRIAGAMLVGGGVDEIRKVSSLVPVYLVNPSNDAVAKYRAANGTDAAKGRGEVVTYFNQAFPLRRVVVVRDKAPVLSACVKDAYYGMFVEAMRVPVALQAMYTAGTPYSGYNFDEAPYSLCKRDALIDGATKDGIRLISHQGETRFSSMKSTAGEYLDSWYEYLPQEVLDGTAAKGTVPLILGNHGGGDDPRLYVDEMGLLALAGDERVAVVAADHQNLPNDVRGPALASLVKYMLKTYPALDPSRVYAIGYSMGGGATYTVAYYQPSLFAGVAPVAGTNIEPTAAEVANFAACQLPIYLSTSSYDVRRLQEACGRINDNLANQVKRWAGFDGVAPVALDFASYKLSGFKGDSWSTETLNGEYASNTWYLHNDKGYPMVALNYVEDLIHALYPQYAVIAWDYLKHFSRDQKTGAIKYAPYLK